MGVLEFFKKQPKINFLTPPETWEDAKPRVMPVLSTEESVQDYLKSKRDSGKAIDEGGVIVTSRLDFVISYVIDLGDGMMPIAEEHLRMWKIDQENINFGQLAYENLSNYINRTKTMKFEWAGDSMAFINTTPNPEDEYVASIAACPWLFSQYVERFSPNEIWTAFPNRYSIILLKPSEAMKLFAEKAIADFYPSVHPRKRVSKSIYRFTAGKDLEIVETLTDERIKEIQEDKI